MATRSNDARPVSGRVDAGGRLIAADTELAALQRDAGSSIGAPFAIPQLAAIARLAAKLNIPISRRAVAAAPSQDVDMWVRAVPEGDEIALTIERWTLRPAAEARLTGQGGDALASQGRGRWAVDDKLRIVSLSPAAAELIGIEADEATGQLLTRLVKLDEDPVGDMPLIQALASRSSFGVQPCRRRSDDSPLVLDGEPATGPDGNFAGFEGTIGRPGDDDSGASAGARPAEPALSEVLHSPLRRIIESAEQIAGRHDGPLRDEYADYASDISAAAHHLLAVVRSTGQQAAGQSSIELIELVYEAVGLIETAASEREITVKIEPLRSFKSRGDPRGVMQILVNLIGNAVRHSPPRATVTISFESANRHSMIHVTDDGPGIAAADHGRIFERFEQATADGQGSGLGLAIARRLAREMAGDIQLESRPGLGSRFSLVLPAA